MPVFTRKQLRRDLAQQFIHDIPLITSNGQGASLPIGTRATLWMVSQAQTADLSLSGENPYTGAWLYVEGSSLGADTALTFFQYTIATFNAGSGAFGTWQYLRSDLNPPNIFEVHEHVAPTDKMLAIDETIRRIRLRQEVGINTIDGCLFYQLDGAAVPYRIERVLDVHIATDPSSTSNPNIKSVGDWDVVLTASGNQLRLQHAFGASQQLLVDAILSPTLGGTEQATINIPDERWILAGAAAKCYDFMIQSAPGQQVAELQKRRAEASVEFTRLTTRFAPEYATPIRFHDITRGRLDPWFNDAR